MKDFCYIALGDSIALGTITYWNGTAGYPLRLLPGLRHRYGGLVFRSFARNGARAEDLLALIKNHLSLREWVRQADLITLSIGGNNLMGAVKVPGFTRFSPPALELGIRRFELAFPLLIQELRQLNPNCHLLVLTVYNPYSPSLEPGLCQVAQPYLNRINQCISIQNQIDLVDGARRFSMGPVERLCCMYPAAAPIFRNPHPTPLGQQVLAELHFQRLIQPSEQEKRTP